MVSSINSYDMKKIISSLFLEVFVAFVIINFLGSMNIIPGRDFFDFTEYDIVRSFWMASPIIFLYLVLRLFSLGCFLSLYLSIVVALAFIFINATKSSLTGEPVSYNDIVAGFNFSLALKYLSVKSIAVIVLAFVFGGIVLLIDKKISLFRTNRPVVIFILFIIVPMVFAPYIYSSAIASNKIKEKIVLLNTKYNMEYYSWDWPGNAQKNGLPIHIIQTSVRRSVPAASFKDVKEFIRIKNITHSVAPIKKTIIFVLCESCWFDNNNFKELFNPLLDDGYVNMRATSPVYGAGTANAEFEMLTGLPSNSEYTSGIIYQEYADIFKDNAESIARSLKEKGYYTFAAHNNSRQFWRRDTVYKKFGFDEFVDFSQMGDVPPELMQEKQPWQWQPDDYLLYNAAIKALEKRKGQPIFMNLISMSTHGPYQHINDSGESVYKHEISESVSRLLHFTREVEKIDKDAVIIIYGDHKPALNKYFYEHGVFSGDMFSRTGSKDEDFSFKLNVMPTEYGDVPVLIKSNDHAALAVLQEEANQKPFYCVASLIDKNLIKSGLFSFSYTQEHGCDEPLYKDENGYRKLIDEVPSWVYSLSLFEEPLDK